MPGVSQIITERLLDFLTTFLEEAGFQSLKRMM